MKILINICRKKIKYAFTFSINAYYRNFHDVFFFKFVKKALFASVIGGETGQEEERRAELAQIAADKAREDRKRGGEGDTAQFAQHTSGLSPSGCTA